MRTLVMILLGVLLLFPLTASATIINIPDDYPTIQEGIDSSSVGDTLLVHPGTYYENLNFNGHNVVLASLFLTTGDTAYVSSTIIDGSGSGHVIIFESGEDSTAQVVGLTICNGNGVLRGGGIYCDRSSPTLSGNTIRGNSADSLGGGIYCLFSSLRISGNTLSGNSSHWGGGIYCHYSDAIISDNIIRENSVTRTGGGIRCESSSPRIINNIIIGNTAPNRHAGGISCRNYSHPTISHNIISGNWGKFGGGISCHRRSDPTIINNVISGNFAEDGGGIFTYNSSNPTIINNIISGNSADYGGGICCYIGSNPRIGNNTITANSADISGGGISCFELSSPTITNSIFWADTAPNGPEIYLQSGSNAIVTYCDVQGGWEGLGNIDADPIFVGPEREDFNIRWHSPCIDAGDPDSPHDPDRTRRDIGAFYFNQAVPGIVELYPHNTPIVIPPEGGEVVYDGWAFNFFGQPGRADIWTFAFVPGVGRYGPVHLYENIRIPADSIGMNEIGQYVPGGAPAGDYVFAAYVGNYPNTIIDSSYFYFTKSGSVAGGVTSWSDAECWFKEGALAESNLPSAYALSQNYPNPFNATAIINYQLPVDGYVKLEVYNVFGQKVATLVGERQGAGYKSVSWDASSVSSGLYFYRLSAGDYTETRRMMLVK